ncbi:MAG: L,D-transpeptidase family protein, partial [Candidatus Latescibacterota bacterium]
GIATFAESPLSDSSQLLLVVTETDSSNQAALGMFTLEGDSWKTLDSWPVVIGKNGLGWGRGLHRDADRVPGEPVKREGDGKSPAGVFRLLEAYGYPPADSVRTRLSYTKTTPDIIGIDDVKSEYYNLVVNFREKGLDPDSLPSHEDMLRNDELYRYVVVVGHNLPHPQPGAGSCIFLHLWRGPGSYTAGCTAMEEKHMVKLLEWLDPAKRPVIVQLTRAGFERLKRGWGLPEML